MARRVTITLHISVPYGYSDEYSIYIGTAGSEVDQPTYLSWKVIEKINSPTAFEIYLCDIDSTDSNVQQGKSVKIFSETTLIFKGKIERVEYESYGFCRVYGYGMEIDLMDRQVDTLSSASGTAGRQTYATTAVSSIIAELCSTNGDGASPWIMQVDSTNDGSAFGNIIGARFENVNKLKALMTVVDAINYEWWIGHGDFPYNTSKFNVATTKGSSTSVYTFTDEGANANINNIHREQDVENLCNYCKVYGYGDGINQVKTSVYAASDVYSTLTSNLATTTTTVSVSDASNFPSSGKAIIAEEVVGYTGKSGNDLTGCTRGDDDNGGTATTKKKHNRGCVVFEYYDGSTYYTATSAKTDSSIDTYGIKEKVIQDRSLIKDQDRVSEPTAELIASRVILKQMDPIERITLEPSETIEINDDIVLGDTVSIIDTKTGLSSTYRIMGLERGQDESGLDIFNIYLSNVHVSYIEEMKKLKESQESHSLAAQGSTFFINQSEKENLDNSTDLDMRFYLPSAIIAINEAKLSFKMKNFRAYSSPTQTSTGGSSHTHGFSGQSSAAATHTHSIGASGAHTHDVPNHQHDLAYCTADWPTSGYPLSSAVGATLADSGATTSGSKTHTHEIGASGSHQHDLSGVTSGAETSHTHTVSMAFAVHEDATIATSVVVTAGVEDSEASVGTYTTDQTNLDLATQIKDAYNDNGPGWYNVKFDANNNLRIEANLFIKGFIESK